MESADGKFFYYATSTAPDRSIWKVPSEGGNEVRILDHLSFVADFDVVADGIYFIQESDSGDTIRFYDFASGKTTIVLSIQGRRGPGLSVSPDRHWLLFSKFNPVQGDLMLVENIRP